MAEAPIYATGGPSWQIVEEGAPGAVLVVDADLPPAGTYTLTGWVVADVDGVPHRQFSFVEFDLPGSQAGMLNDLGARYQALLNQGFPATIDGATCFLQLRDADDKVNWLTFKDACEDQIAAGGGDVVMPMTLRDGANVDHTITANAGRSLAMAMRTWGAAAMANSWRLKDLITNAATKDDLAAVDLSSGWPS